MLEGVGRCGQVLEGVGRCGQVLEGVGRCGQMAGAHKALSKTCHKKAEVICMKSNFTATWSGVEWSGVAWRGVAWRRVE